MTDYTLADVVEIRSVDELLPYVNNPKKHPDPQIDKIASSIKNFGWDQPIVVDADGEIIKGHGRLQAAKRLGIEEVPVIERADLSKSEAKASRIADNKTAESPWDYELVATELDTLDEFTVEDLGFDQDEWDDITDEIDDSIPEFSPVDESEQPRLDETEPDDPVECPDCGHTFVP